MAVREKYTILASVAMDEVKEEMKNPKAQRTCKDDSPRDRAQLGAPPCCQGQGRG